MDFGLKFQKLSISCDNDLEHRFRLRTQSLKKFRSRRAK